MPDAVTEVLESSGKTAHDVENAVADRKYTPEEVEGIVEDAVTTGTLVSPAFKEAKAGYKTTEFWLTTVIAFLTLIGTFPIPGSWEPIIAGALTIAYALSRGIAKSGVPHTEADPDAAV